MMRLGNVAGITSAIAASFISPSQGWVAGNFSRYAPKTVGGEKVLRVAESGERIVYTNNGGRTWQTLYSMALTN